MTEFSFLIRYYNLLHQSLIPNCKLTIKTLKQHLGDIESFIINGDSSRIRCQRIINLLLVQLDTTRDYKHFCYLFNMISVMTDLTDKLRTGMMVIVLYNHKCIQVKYEYVFFKTKSCQLKHQNPYTCNYTSMHLLYSSFQQFSQFCCFANLNVITYVIEGKHLWNISFASVCY